MDIYKILHRNEWVLAQAAGVFQGSAADLADGFIHFSTAAQVEATAQKHFLNQADLVVLLLDDRDLGDALKYEPSRGGDLFPHLYGALMVEHVIQVMPMTLDGNGVPRLSLPKA